MGPGAGLEPATYGFVDPEPLLGVIHRPPR